MSNSLQKLRSFQRLPKGWHFGEGIPTPKHVIETAESLVQFAIANSVMNDVFPGLSGEVAVVFYFESISVEVIINLDNNADYCIEEKVGFKFEEIEYHENVKMHEVYGVLKKYVR